MGRINLSGIPWTYIDFSAAPSTITISPTGTGTLVMEFLLRSDAVTIDNCLLRFNGDSAGTYHSQYVNAQDGTAATADEALAFPCQAASDTPTGSHAFTRLTVPNISGSQLKLAMLLATYYISPTALGVSMGHHTRTVASTGAITDAITSTTISRASGTFTTTSWGRWRVE